MKKFIVLGSLIMFLMACDTSQSKKFQNFSKEHVVYGKKDLRHFASRAENTYEVEKFLSDQVYHTSKQEIEATLDFDLFLPKNKVRDRSLIIFLHPGGFVRGSKDHALTQALSQTFAAQGYATLAANYQLPHESENLVEVVGQLFKKGKLAKARIYKSLQHVRSLVAYCHSHADSWGVDPDNIYLAGYSAGATLALNYAFMNEQEAFIFFKHKAENCLDCLPFVGENAQTVGIPQIKGVMSIAGAVLDTAHIQATDRIPTLLIHGNRDNMVPMSRGIPFKKYKKAYKWKLGDAQFDVSRELSGGLIEFLSLPVYGSGEVYKHMPQNVRFVEISGWEHRFMPNDATFDMICQEMSQFLDRVHN